MQKFKLLILTDYQNHSAENSLYFFVPLMQGHSYCAQLDIASRGVPENDSFFNAEQAAHIFVSQPDAQFQYEANGKYVLQNLRKENLEAYDFIWLRLPPPLSHTFLKFLSEKLPRQIILNKPEAIYKTGTKEFLLNFPQCCPPLQICRSVEDIIAFKNKFPIVLKPFRDYGGKGIVRINGDRVWDGLEEKTFEQFLRHLNPEGINYLGVKFLKNVSQGDKRIVIVGGKIMGASVRLPKSGSWLCNVSMGGSSQPAVPDEEETKIVETINPSLEKMGIVMYGIDTLVGDDGKRVLSEINTTSIGGLPAIAAYTGKPVVEEAADIIWKTFVRKYQEQAN
jgi:glutathione synthase